MLVSLFSVRVLLEGFGNVDYGIYNVVAGFVLLFGFFNSSLISGTQRFYNYEMGIRGSSGIASVYLSALRIQFVIAIIIILLLETVGGWYLNYRMVIPEEKMFEANWLMQLSLVSLLLNMLYVPYASALAAHEEFNIYALVGVMDTILKLVIAYVIMFVSSNRLLIYGVLLLIISIINFIIYYIYCRKHYPVMFSKVQHDSKLTRSMISFMGWNTVGSSSYLVRNQGINLLFNTFFGVILNASNGIATQVAGAISHFSANLVAAFKPQLVQAYAIGDSKTSYYMMDLMTRVSFGLMTMLAIPLVLDIDFILNLWLGDRVPTDTGILSVLVIISLVIASWHTPIVQLIHAIGKMGKFQLVTSICILLIIPLTWLGFFLGLRPAWAYYATIIAYLINQIAAMIVLHEKFPYSYKEYVIQTIMPCILFLVLCSIVPFIFRIYLAPSLIQLLALCMVTVIWALLLFPLIILTKEERSRVLPFIKNKLK